MKKNKTIIKKTKQPLTMKKLGIVGVDSGQLIICDPCYIDSQWKDEQYLDVRAYKHKFGKLLVYKTALVKEAIKRDKKNITKDKKIEYFDNFESKTSFKKSVNQMVEDKEAVEIEVEEKKKFIGSFSYAGVCETNQHGQNQLNYQMGHPGAGVTFHSGYGDGVYPVIGWFNSDGRCVKVEIDCGLTPVQKKFLQSLK